MTHIEHESDVIELFYPIPPGLFSQLVDLKGHIFGRAFYPRSFIIVAAIYFPGGGGGGAGTLPSP